MARLEKHAPVLDQIPLFPETPDAPERRGLPAVVQPHCLSLRAGVLRAFTHFLEKGGGPAVDQMLLIEEGQFGTILIANAQGTWVGYQATEQARPIDRYQIPCSVLRGIPPKATVQIRNGQRSIEIEARHRGADILAMHVPLTRPKGEGALRRVLKGWHVVHEHRDFDFDPELIARIERTARHCGTRAVRHSVIRRDKAIARVQVSDDQRFVGVIHVHRTEAHPLLKSAWPFWAN